ncbi:MAG: OmpH family outer membrane protein [Prevotellaceae bacterium]|jgi:outer membrane protein|nr:OmpH family outer membrane protein [Prevotellaceae bacterium]GHT35172.1 membrane protein [Bacteroidia bacterium]
MKKIALFLLFALPFTAFAQDLKFGHIDRQEVIKLMPEFTTAQKTLEDLQLKYKEEISKLQTEFQTKLADYQQNGDKLEATIKASRESELQRMQSNFQDFYQKAQDDLQAKEVDLMKTITDKLNKAIQEVGTENGFLYIFDVQGKTAETGPTTVLYYSPKSTDVAPLVKKKLNIK